MSVTYHKMFFTWNFQKEEEWINRMSQKGLQLIDPGLVHYTFVNGKAGEYQYRLEMLPHFPSHPKSQDYIHFVEDTGAEYVGSVKNWVYFRKKTEEGPFELFNDLHERISHFRRISVMIWICLIWLFMYPTFFVVPQVFEGVIPYPKAACVQISDLRYIVSVEHTEDYPEILTFYSKKDEGKTISAAEFQPLKKLPFHQYNNNVSIVLLDTGMYVDYSPWFAIETEDGYVLKQNKAYVRQHLRAYSPLLFIVILYIPLILLFLNGIMGLCAQIRYLRRELRIRES